MGTVIGFLISSLLGLYFFSIFKESPRLKQVPWHNWFFALIITTFLDAFSTYRLIPYVGVHKEGNPIARYLFENMGVVHGLFIHSGIVTIIMLIFGITMGKKNEMVRFTIFVFATLHLIAALWNQLIT